MPRFATTAASLIALNFLGFLAGCEEKKTSVGAAASSLAPSTAPPPVASAASSVSPSPAAATVMKFLIDPESKTSIEMPAPKEKIKATTKGGTGSLDIDLANLTASRGEVKMDLTTLTTATFPEAEKNKSQTMHARTWLEVADGEDGKLEEKVKEGNRYAVYAIRSVENVKPGTDVTKLPVTKEGEDEVRSVTLVTKGELLIHGHKVNRDGDVKIDFHYAPGAEPNKPKWVAIQSQKPFEVHLAEHEVKPRDGFGKLAKQSFHLLGTKVADDAFITLDLRAKPAP